MNLYRYAFNNPVHLTDPTGTSVAPFFKVFPFAKEVAEKKLQQGLNINSKAYRQTLESATDYLSIDTVSGLEARVTKAKDLVPTNGFRIADPVDLSAEATKQIGKNITTACRIPYGLIWLLERIPDDPPSSVQNLAHITGFVPNPVTQTFSNAYNITRLISYNTGLDDLWQDAFKELFKNKWKPDDPQWGGRARRKLGLAQQQVVGSRDPNDKVGVGAGLDGFVAAAGGLLYTVRFENVSTATAAAQEVVVTDQLDADLDWATLELRSMEINSVKWNFPAGLRSYTGEFHVPSDPNPVTVKITFDMAIGLLTWRFTSIDPVTGLLVEDPLAGFLPPNDATHRGEGYVTYTIRPKPGLPNGTELRNQASIVFDVNDPIVTPTVLNTIDSNAPSSKVAPLPGASASNFTVHWAGSDNSNGSGLANYMVYVSDDAGGSWRLWLTNTPETEAIFTGQPGKYYSFYSVATDNVGNLELANTQAAVSTLVLESSLISVEQPAGSALKSGSSQVNFGPVLRGSSRTLRFTVLDKGPVGLGKLALAVDGANAGDFKAGTLATRTLAVGASTTFDVTFAPKQSGSHGAKLHVTSDDPLIPSFDITLTGTGSVPLVPEIAIEYPPKQVLVDGSSSCSFGTVEIKKAVAQTFTIRNTGSANLTNLAVTINGTHAKDFIIGNPLKTSLPPGASTTFMVTFKPHAAGTRKAAIHIRSNDKDENPFDISINGKAVTAPEIVVEQPAQTGLKDGAATISFGSAVLNAPVAKTFTIRNPGSASLSNLAVTIDGTAAKDFIIVQPLATSLSPGGSTTFTVTFKPLVGGARKAAIHIRSNDSDENPFDIVLSGNGLTAPEIAVLQPAKKSLKDGSAAVSFGTVAVKKTVSKTFTIRNTGSAKLTKLAVTINGRHAKDFIVGKPRKTSPATRWQHHLQGDLQAAGRRRPQGGHPYPQQRRQREPVRHQAARQGQSQGRHDGTQSRNQSRSAGRHLEPRGRAPATADESLHCAPAGWHQIPDAQRHPAAGGFPRHPSHRGFPNLVDWFSGSRHTTVMRNAPALLKVRDNTPLTPEVNRYIRVRPKQN